MKENSNPPSDREAAIFEAALQLPPEQRSAHIQSACGDDQELRQRVEALLKAHSAAGNFLEDPAVPQTKRTIVFSLPPEEKPGERIGRYKILQKIGEGGCGVVYMAEQEEPVRRRVALKVIKLGMDTKQVIARFEAERQALAMMDHPNIARVLDAGSTDNGRPFFVMELVRGIKITEYCDQNKLSTEQRLQLFVQVCNAIQHAHQKGIIHRDIKPSNILVTLHDGVPVPKVIDFGIAKATQGRLTDQTLFTAFEQFIGTPAYMSPEQAEMSGLDIDTRCDIYALGVLLYELLTGQTPFDAKELMASGLDKMRQTIREQEPQRPSTRLSTMVDKDLTTTAGRRHTDAPKLIHTLRGDLDWIVMKALEKDRTRRFETANGFAMDVQRYLHNEPVLASPPSTFYRFQKLVRRNRAAFVAVGSGVTALVLGLVLSLYLFVQERAAHKRAVVAEREQARMRAAAEEDARLGEQVGKSGLFLSQGKYDEAEAILNGVPEYPALAALYNVLGMVHAKRGEWRQAITNYARVAKFLPDAVETQMTLGDLYARHGLWANAVSNYSRAVALAPTNYLAYHYLAPLLLQTGDLEGYRRHRELMLSRFGDETDGETAGALAKDCLILPPPGAALNTIGKWVDAAMKVSTNRPAWGDMQLAKGLAEYRSGRFGRAVEILRPLTPQKYPWNRNAEAHMVLAMALEQLQKTAEARTTLSNGVEVVDTQLDKLSSGLGGGDWNDWIIARLLMREAGVPEHDQPVVSDESPAKPAWLKSLQNAGYKLDPLQFDDGSWLVSIDNQPFKDQDLATLRDVRISRLSLMRTKISDLRPLQDMPLTRLQLADTEVTDLRPLQGMKLFSLQVSRTPVTDLSPIRGMQLRFLLMTDAQGITNLDVLKGMTSLQGVILPPNAKGIEFLRDMTNILRISYKYDPVNKGPAQSAAEFWAEFDKANAKP